MVRRLPRIEEGIREGPTRGESQIKVWFTGDLKVLLQIAVPVVLAVRSPTQGAELESRFLDDIDSSDRQPRATGRAPAVPKNADVAHVRQVVIDAIRESRLGRAGNDQGVASILLKTTNHETIGFLRETPGQLHGALAL